MSYYDALKLLYSDLKDDEFRLQDDGDGIYLAKWSRKEKKPDLKKFDDALKQMKEIQNLTAKVSPLKEELKETDWYALRSIDDDKKPIPDEIKKKRAELRETISIIDSTIDRIKKDLKNLTA